MEPDFDIDLIVLKYVRDRYLSTDEVARLRQWLAESNDPDRRALVERMKTDPDWVQEELLRMQQVNVEGIWSKVESRIKQAPSIPLSSQTKRRRWFYAAAASIILVAAGTSWFWVSKNHSAPHAVSVATTIDVKPGGNKAVLTLADGRRIDLGASANGVLANQGSSSVAKLSDGQLAYKKETTNEKPDLAFNSLATPRAGQFTLLLPDGTKVWLNNASVIRYPVAFTGPDRSVELAGEAYFEVAKDAAHPFRVKIQGGATVDVLGTSFNIMAYSDEPTERTTLLDGSIRVTENSQSALLKPAEQSSLDPAGKLRVTSDVNVQEVVAWKNGFFHFDHASLETTMRQLARWYDIDVVYEGQLPSHEFVGRIQRDLPLKDVLKGLESDQIHFKLDGRKLIVTP
jgi:transmembrane sensor